MPARFRVISDINRQDISLKEIARELDVSKSAIIGWRAGAEPGHSKGEALIDFWLHVTHQSRDALPVNVTGRRFVYRGRDKC
ncbi:hypothetical protein B1H58_14715 [Pantoea alhagi]|uniref:HTH cro/C1-type domain-containing protein n=1 Tax=Pantoea alhagi TaxID=1891675 RepID=A0A1W6BB67_9GAMM|nr:hypothetical protein B1H58_14715 [Pantoea alhagi]